MPSTIVTSGLSSLLSDAHAIAMPANVRTVMMKLLIPPKNEIMLPKPTVDEEYWDVTIVEGTGKKAKRIRLQGKKVK